jgi:hypothetical protein
MRYTIEQHHHDLLKDTFKAYNDNSDFLEEVKKSRKVKIEKNLKINTLIIYKFKKLIAFPKIFDVRRP